MNTPCVKSKLSCPQQVYRRLLWGIFREIPMYFPKQILQSLRPPSGQKEVHQQPWICGSPSSSGSSLSTSSSQPPLPQPSLSASVSHHKQGCTVNFRNTFAEHKAWHIQWHIISDSHQVYGHRVLETQILHRDSTSQESPCCVQWPSPPNGNLNSS